MPELKGRQELAANRAHDVGVSVSRGAVSRPTAANTLDGVERSGEAVTQGAAGIVRYAYGVPFRTAIAQSNQAAADAPVLSGKTSPKAEPPAAQAEQSATPKKGRGARKSESREELLARLLDPTLTLEETARMLEVCPATVRRYTNRGILAHERSKGNQRRFKLSTVLAFMESQSRVEPHGESG